MRRTVLPLLVILLILTARAHAQSIASSSSSSSDETNEDVSSDDSADTGTDDTAESDSSSSVEAADDNASVSSQQEGAEEASASSSAESVSFRDFTDIDPHAWYGQYVRAVVEWGLASGYRDEDGRLTHRFGPADPVTVGQMLKMAVLAAHIDPSQCDSAKASWFAADHWAGPYVVCAQEHGARLFRHRVGLDRPILRSETVGLMHDIFGTGVPPLPSVFRDTDGNPYASDIAFDAARGIVSGTKGTDGTPTGFFLPSTSLNRAEASKILYLTLHSDEQAAPVGLQSATFNITVSNFAFVPSVIVVQKGQKVTIHFAVTGMHTFNVDELSIHHELLRPEDTLTFTADKTGDFTFSCDMPGHEAAGMVGELIVK